MIDKGPSGFSRSADKGLLYAACLEHLHKIFHKTYFWILLCVRVCVREFLFLFTRPEMPDSGEEVLDAVLVPRAVSIPGGP